MSITQFTPAEIVLTLIPVVVSIGVVFAGWWWSLRLWRLQEDLESARLLRREILRSLVAVNSSVILGLAACAAIGRSDHQTSFTRKLGRVNDAIHHLEGTVSLLGLVAAGRPLFQATRRLQEDLLAARRAIVAPAVEAVRTDGWDALPLWEDTPESDLVVAVDDSFADFVQEARAELGSSILAS